MAEASSPSEPEPETEPEPLGVPSRGGLQNAFAGAGLGAIIVGVIYFGQPILMPAALAILLAFALAPLVARLRAVLLASATAASFGGLCAMISARNNPARLLLYIRRKA